jgi:epoxyqueuosine reductase
MNFVILTNVKTRKRWGMREQIAQKAIKLGFHEVSFLPALPSPSWDDDIRLRRELDPNSAAYWEARGLTGDFKSIMADAKTIIIAIYPYQPFDQRVSQGQGRYSAHYQAYPKGRDAMKQIGAIIANEGYEVIIDPPISVKRLAYQGSLGTYGKNGLIYHPEFGSFITLHTILTNAQLEWDTVNTTDTEKISDCGKCRRCIDACPTRAIADNGIIMLSKCLRYHMSSSDIIPMEIREKIGNRILGCEECQLICPKNVKQIKEERPKKSQEIYDVRAILTNAKTGLKKQMDPIAYAVGNNYARPQKVLSMAV